MYDHREVEMEKDRAGNSLVQVTRASPRMCINVMASLNFIHLTLL